MIIQTNDSTNVQVLKVTRVHSTPHHSGRISPRPKITSLHTGYFVVLQQHRGILSIFCSGADGAMASQQTNFAATLFFWSNGGMARPQGCASLMTGLLLLYQKL